MTGSQDNLFRYVPRRGEVNGTFAFIHNIETR